MRKLARNWSPGSTTGARPRPNASISAVIGSIATCWRLVLSPRLSSLWLHLVTPVRAGVARPLVEGLRNPTVAADDRIRSLVPFEPTSFDAAAREALDP
jgi:hypothetical protein